MQSCCMYPVKLNNTMQQKAVDAAISGVAQYLMQRYMNPTLNAFNTAVPGLGQVPTPIFLGLLNAVAVIPADWVNDYLAPQIGQTLGGGQGRTARKSSA